MEITITKASPGDAAEILKFLRTVGGETDNLTFGSEGVPFTVEEEIEYIKSLNNSTVSVLFIARKGNEIIGDASLSGTTVKRLKHTGELGICVKKSEWGNGVGSKLMGAVIDFARNEANTEIITLNVRSDNYRAIKLYEKFGFKKYGCFKNYFKIDNEYIDFDFMNLYL